MLSSLVVTGVEMASCHVEVNTYEDKNDREDVLMEDDMPQSDSEQEVSSVIGGPLPVDSVGIKFHVEEQFHTAQGSADPDSSLLVLSEKKSPTCSSEQESSLIPSHDVLRFARPVSEDCGQIIDSPAPTNCPSTSKRENSLTCPVVKESSRVLEAAEAECTKSKKYYGQVVKEDSPFGFLQGYASDDSTGNDEEPHLKNPGPKTVIPLVEVGAETLHKDSVFDLETNAQLNSKSPSKTGRGLRLLSISSGLKTVHVDSKNEDPTSISYMASPKSHQLDDANKSATVSSKVQKIDRFGRLVREGATESDSDESLYAGRHSKRRRSQSRSQSPPYAGRSKRRRSRSQSRSRSPPDRRRRRSPRRRRHQRSRSRSRSPRNRRSRSPSSRHAGEFRSGRRDKGHMAECFDFLRGKCYRGSSCRYLHHHSEKAHWSKQQNPQPPSGLKTSNTHEQTEKISIKTSGYEDDTRFNHDMPGSSNTVHKEAMSSNDAVQSVISNEVAAVCSDTNKFGWPTEVSAKPQEINVVQQEVETCENLDKAMESNYNLPLVVSSSPSGPRGDSDTVKSHCEASQYVFSSLKDSAIKQSESDLLVAVLEDADPPPPQAGASFISDSYPNRTSATSPKKLLVSEAPQDAVDSVHNCSQTLSVSEHVNVALTKQPSMASNLMPQTARFQYQSAHSEGFPPYMLPNQNSVFSVVPNSSWATMRSLPPPPPLPLPPPPPLPLPLPPPPPLPLPPPPQLPLPPPPPLFPPHDHNSLNRGTASLGTSLQFQQSHVPPMTKFGPQMFLRPYPTEFPSHSQSVESQHQGYPPLHEPGRTLLPGCNTSNQQFRGPTQIREDQSMHLPTQGLNAANSFTQGMNYPHPMTLLQASPATKMHSFHQDNLPSGEILKPSSIVNPHLQQQQPQHALSRSALDDVYTMSGKISTSPRCPPLTLDTNQPSPVPDYVVSRSSTHYNPYASTFEQPLNSRFSSDVLGQEKDTTSATKYDYPLCLNHASGDGQAASVGSMHATSAPKPAGGVGPVIPGPGGDQYDPLFDSIEPSSNSIKKFDHIPKWEPSNASDIMSSLSGSKQPLDVEENNTKEVGGVALAASSDNEEFGETADAEVRTAENESESYPDAVENANSSEMEIDQIMSPGKSEKSKESRLMKHFKVALADFVKGVLKPSWRQGNMSKEAFKTVVKKTVDKASGAMKSHQIPKSKAKINQYIDSSERKLTKLVMGYVDKYAKG